MKKTFKTLLFATLGLLALASCEDVPAPYPVPDNGNGNGDEPTTIEVNCAQAIELTNALADGATSTETYTITGYITAVVGDVSRNQQTFWMADTKNGGRMFEAYWANLPEGVSAFTAGSKVKITGNLTKYVNSNTGKVTAEIKNPTVEILENGEGEDTPSGTEVTCAQAVELTNALADGGTSSETYTVTGYITEVVGSVSKNQQTFWMADTKNGGKVFEAYWANLPEGVSEFKTGMKVKITGNLMKYVKGGKVTPEIKNANVEILENSEGGEDTPSGTEITCAKAAELTNALADGATSLETYTVAGYITEVVGSVSRNQQSFWMADTKDGGKVFEAYYANLPEGVNEFKAGMKVKITGNLMKYVKDGKVTPEIKNANVEILENGEGGDTPSGDAGTLDNPYTVAQALEIINAGTYTKDKVYVSGIVSKIDEISTQYGNATYYISDDGKTDKQLQVFRGYTLGGEKFQSEDDLMVGDKVIVWGVLTLYNSKTPEITGSQLYSINDETAGGGSGGGSATGDASSFNAADLGLTNGAAFDKVTYNGLTITTDGGGNNNTPKYYDSGSNLRMYPKNSITISAGKTISSIKLTCFSGSVANGNVKASKGNVNVSDPTISITGINDKSVTITNNDGSTGAASQIRIVKFDITYAE
ncbi:MAG: hypothetical protein K6F20_05605 [Bacteroidaceae bacterium]|nr:hypothetical protein [Bacteroidaceae bacterium]